MQCGSTAKTAEDLVDPQTSGAAGQHDGHRHRHMTPKRLQIELAEVAEAGEAHGKR